MNTALRLLFLVSSVLTIVLLFVLPFATRTRAAIGAAIVVFLGAAWYFTASPASPFGNPPIAFGPDDWTALIVAVAGSICGVVASPFILTGGFDPKSSLRALLATPITLVPVIQGLGQVPDRTYFSLVLVFLLAYQGSVFWERALR